MCGSVVTTWRCNQPSSYRFDPNQFLTIGIGDVHGTGNAGIEAVNGAQDFNRLFGIMQMVSDQRGFIRPGLTLGVTRP